MPLLGQGAFVAWHGIVEGREADYDRWHSHEHMLERVAIPGFLRGRRYTADQALRYLVVYEVIDIGVLTSPAYLDRLNHPTTRTREIMPAVRGMNRTLCRVEASFGRGVGSHVLSIRLAPQAEREQMLTAWLRAELGGRLAGSSGLVGAHPLRADAAASRTPTQERQLRATPDAVADWVVLIEGYDEATVRDVWSGALSPKRLNAAGALPDALGDVYALAYLMTHEDIAG